MALFGGLREKLERVYAQHSQLIDVLARFLLAAGMCFLIREAAPYSGILSNPVLMLALSAILAFLPVQLIPAAGAALVIGQAFGLDLIAGGVALAVSLVIFLLFLRFVPDAMVYAALTPMTMFFGLDALIPICCGLRRSPSSVFAVCPGAVVYGMLASFSKNAEALKSMEENDFAGKLQLLIRGTFGPELYVTLLALAGTLILTSALMSSGINYAPYLAVLFGGLTYLLFHLIGQAVLQTESHLPVKAVGVAASVAAAYILLLIWMPLRYSKSERLHFEDDNYYYFVKAVPKARAQGHAGESSSFRAADERGRDRS